MAVIYTGFRIEAVRVLELVSEVYTSDVSTCQGGEMPASSVVSDLGFRP